MPLSDSYRYCTQYNLRSFFGGFGSAAFVEGTDDEPELTESSAVIFKINGVNSPPPPFLYCFGVLPFISNSCLCDAFRESAPSPRFPISYVIFLSLKVLRYTGALLPPQLQYARNIFA